MLILVDVLLNIAAIAGKELNMTIQKAINSAINGGWRQGIKEDYEALKCSHTERTVGDMVADTMVWQTILLDPKFWESLGKELGWGKWSKELSDIKHSWKISYYAADRKKTPVYQCKKCYARKIKDVVAYEVNGVWEENPEFDKAFFLQSHGAVQRSSWQRNWHRLLDHIEAGESIEDYFKKLV